MPPLPVIANTYRCAIVGTSQIGVTPVNVLHLSSTLGNKPDVGAALWEAMEAVGYQFGSVPVGFAANVIQVLPLDGTSATSLVPRPEEYTPADHYTDNGAFVPEAAAIVSLRTGARGPSGRGRVFLGPCAEGVMADGSISSDTRTAIQTAWDEFQLELVSNHDSALVVASYTDAVARPVETILVRLGIGTQRRRLLQQR